MTQDGTRYSVLNTQYGVQSDRPGTSRPLQPAPAPSPRIGLVAGWGRYPLLIAKAMKRQGYEVHCIGLKNHADPQLRDLCDSFIWSGVARLGAHIRYFRRRGIGQATLAGKLFKDKLLFGRFGWLSLVPD